MSGALLEVNGISVSFDGFKAINSLSFNIDNGELRAIIGPNGAGKTTFMDIITGKTRPDSGDVIWGEKNISLIRKSESEIANLGVGRKFQKPTIFEDQSVMENLIMALKNNRSPLSVLFYKYNKIDHNKVVKNDDSLKKWLKLLHEYGFAIIKKAPTKKKSAFKILNRISHHRETFFGTPFEVINVPKPNNTAYTADALRNHTDLPYFEYAPGYQFLHCLVNDAKGGNSSVVDGFAVASYLRKYEEEAFKLLTNTYVKFKDTDYTQKATRVLHSPLITLTKDKDFNDIRFSMAAMGTIDIDSNKMKKFYEAYYLFAKLLHSKKFKIDFRLESGDIFCFNNRRVLHGRTAFDPNSGNRHLQGYYLERDEILARLNYFNKLQV